MRQNSQIIARLQAKEAERKRGLNDSQEQELIAEVESRAYSAKPMTRREFGYLARLIQQNYSLQSRLTRAVSGRFRPMSKQWKKGFMTRHSSFSFRKASNLIPARAKALNPANVDHFFSLLSIHISSRGFTPSQVWNFDEKGFLGQPNNFQRVIGPKSMNRLNNTELEYHEHFSWSAFISADGHYEVPTLILKVVEQRPVFHEKCIDGLRICIQENGYYCQETFLEALKCFHLKTARIRRPILVILDGSYAHIGLEGLRYAKSIGVELLALPSNTTHRLQPLDVSIYGPLGSKFKEEVELFKLEFGHAFKKENVAQLVSQAWIKIANEQNIKAGFRNAGIYPVDRSKISLKDIAPARRSREGSLATSSAASSQSQVEPITVSNIAAARSIIADLQEKLAAAEAKAADLARQLTEAKQPKTRPASINNQTELLTSDQVIARLEAIEAQKKAAEDAKLARVEARTLKRQRREAAFKPSKRAKPNTQSFSYPAQVVYTEDVDDMVLVHYVKRVTFKI